MRGALHVVLVPFVALPAARAGDGDPANPVVNVALAVEQRPPAFSQPQCPSSVFATGSQAGHRYRLTWMTCQPKLQTTPAT